MKNWKLSIPATELSVILLTPGSLSFFLFAETFALKERNVIHFKNGARNSFYIARFLAVCLAIACFTACNPRADTSSGTSVRGGASPAELRCPGGAHPVEEHPASGGSFEGKSVYCVREGVREGPFVNYYRSWAKMGEGTYRKGLLHGKHINYYENGRIMSTGQFVEGKATGESKSWYPNGNPGEERKLSEHGHLVAITVWHENGHKQRQLIISVGNSAPCGAIMSWSSAGLPEPAESYFEIFGCTARPDGAICPPCPEK